MWKFSKLVENGKHSKRSKKHKKSSKRKDSSSSEEEWVEAEVIEKQKKHFKANYDHSSDESSDEEIIKKRKSQRDRSTSSSSRSSSDGHSRNKKKRNTKKKKKRRNYSSSEYSDNDEPTKQSKSYDNHSNPTRKMAYTEDQDTVNKREEWMDLSTSFSSISNLDRRRQRQLEKNEQKNAQQYDPTKCPRELNPYWKDGGDGLPKFQKPRDNDDDSDNNFYSYSRNKTSNNHAKHQRTWRKSTSSNQDSKTTKTANIDINISKESKNAEITQQQKENPTFTEDILTEKELNLLAGKLVKAEIMGNNKLVQELKEKLEHGRKALADAKVHGEEVLLTHTDRQGYSKPLPSHSEIGETSGSKKQRKKAMDTHKDKQRVRYFPDDDKFSLKQMFENETFKSSSDQDREFMKIASNIRKNDDLDDLFADNVRRKKSDAKLEEANRSKAINEHKKMSDSLDRCSKCIQSSVMPKHLIISMGEYIYLSLPAHEPLLEGHCHIIPIRHVSSITQLDENEWDEMVNFQKALIRLFDSKGQEAVFFEIATGFHRYPHMILECVPMPKEEGEIAPIYFKKAIDESETEWSHNKKLVPLKGRGLRRAIPRGLPYFSVMFGMNDGFAHVIEDEKLFPKNFAQEIIGGILDLHHSKWRNPSRQPYDVQSKRVLAFSSVWKDFDCTIHG